MNPQEQFWQGEAGVQYTARNTVDWWARVPFWSRIIALTLPERVLEVGCNAGWNLMAIRACWGEAVQVGGVEINDVAAQRARDAGFRVVTGSFERTQAHSADLVFTSGVLIHIAPEAMAAAMDRVISASKRYVLAIEYEHSWEQEIEYRGERQRLWKRPFGKLYQEQGLHLVEYWPNVDGWDRCAAWLLRKP